MAKRSNKANDRDPNVQIEIAAARMRTARFGSLGNMGWDGHRTSSDWQTDNHVYLAGWLSREICCRVWGDNDPGWPWEPTRPVDGQYEEFTAHKAAEDTAPSIPVVDDRFDHGGDT